MGCLAPQLFIGESCLHSSKPYFFPILGAEATSQITRVFFFSQPLLICQRLISPCQPRQNVTRHSSSLKQCAISNSIFFFFYPYRSLVQVPNSVPFCTLPRRQCGTFENRRYFSAGGLWEAQVWSWLDDWLIQGVSSLVSRWRELFTLRHAAPKCGT